MKSLIFLTALVAVAACSQNPTAPSPANIPGLREVRNPSGTGQPNASCEQETTAPSGFDSPGFPNAQSHYAGGEDSHSNPDNTHAVSQYDIACHQLSSK